MALAIHFSDRAKTGLLWASIGLAVLTSLFQGLITAVVEIAEDQSMWTFRFRIARYEHDWWTAISTLLFLSFSLITVSFLSGNTSDSLGVLALSTATTIAIVRYAIPAWRNRRFMENRWQAWTGNSRTAINSSFANVVGNKDQWMKIAAVPGRFAMVPAPSDEWGWAVRKPPGLWQDAHALLSRLDDPDLKARFACGGGVWPLGPCVYDDGLHGVTGSVSLLWGEQEGFRKRVSRGVNSMPIGLLKSRPFTIDGYNGEGLCLALGILGRNKGLDPRSLVFDYQDKVKKSRGVVRDRESLTITAELENSSAWSPRPNKVMRSYYRKAIDEQFGGLSEAYCGAATELALLLLDCTPQALRCWLQYNLDQQSMVVNHLMSQRPSPLVNFNPDLTATPLELQTLYRASYTSMIISLNYYVGPNGLMTNIRNSRNVPIRPDLTCFALLYLAEGATEKIDGMGAGYKKGPGAIEPRWWRQTWVGVRLAAEHNGLKSNFRETCAWLLGLQRWPPELDQWPTWPKVRYQPVHPNGI